MNISISNNINVFIQMTPKKKKSNKEIYDIYMTFTVTQNGILSVKPTCISTGISVPMNMFADNEFKGRNSNSKLYNERLTDNLIIARDLLQKLSFKGVRTCSEVRNEIGTSIKIAITGKAPKGLKDNYLSKLNEYSVDSIFKVFIINNKISLRRQEKYKRGIALLTEFYKIERGYELPIISNIQMEDIQEFKIWYNRTYLNAGKHTLNTATTYLATLPPLFNFALKKSILVVSPIPSCFTDGWEKGAREILDDNEILSLMSFNGGLKVCRTELSKTEKIAKYCMLFQCLTGIGYGDLRHLKKEHIKNINGNIIIQKRRQKTNVEFTCVLTANGRHVLEKLQQTACVDDNFNLPSIEYSLRIYKQIGKAVGITKNIGTYTFRHTFAVNFMNNNGNFEDLQKILGHVDIKNTKLYGEITRQRLTKRMMELETSSSIHQLNLNI